MLVDPTVWNETHIKSWLDWMTEKFNIKPSLNISKFPKSGQELVALAKADFWVCAGSGANGNLLAEYIAHNLHSATGKNVDHLLDKNDPGKVYNRSG